MTRAKRTLDLVGAGAGVVPLSPLFLMVALPVKAVRRDGPHPTGGLSRRLHG